MYRLSGETLFTDFSVMKECIKWFLPKDTSDSTKQNALLVHGAFGCGKSYLLVAIIRFISALLDEVGDTETSHDRRQVGSCT